MVLSDCGPKGLPSRQGPHHQLHFRARRLHLQQGVRRVPQDARGHVQLRGEVVVESDTSRQFRSPSYHPPNPTPTTPNPTYTRLVCTTTTRDTVYEGTGSPGCQDAVDAAGESCHGVTMVMP